MRDALIPYLHTAVLCSARLEHYSWTDKNDISLLCTDVKLYDYERAKLIATTDHCWLWMKEPAYDTIVQSPICPDATITLHELVHFCGLVVNYTRKNGTKDYGIRLRDFFPLTTDQQAIVRKANNKRFESIPANDKLRRLVSLYSYKLRIEHRVCDWRDLAKYSKKDALANISGQISYFQGWLYPVYGKQAVDREINKALEALRTQLDM